MTYNYNWNQNLSLLSKAVVKRDAHITALLNNRNSALPVAVIKQLCKLLSGQSSRSACWRRASNFPPWVEGNSCCKLQKQSLDLQDPTFIYTDCHRTPPITISVQKWTSVVDCRNEAWILKIQASFLQSAGRIHLPSMCRRELLWLAAGTELGSSVSELHFSTLGLPLCAKGNSFERLQKWGSIDNLHFGSSLEELPSLLCTEDFFKKLQTFEIWSVSAALQKSSLPFHAGKRILPKSCRSGDQDLQDLCSSFAAQGRSSPLLSRQPFGSHLITIPKGRTAKWRGRIYAPGSHIEWEFSKY